MSRRSGHTSWATFKKAHGLVGKDSAVQDQITLAYTKGYLLALEDLLRDMDDINHEVVVVSDAAYLLGRGDALSEVLEKVNQSLRQAERTLGYLTKEKVP